METEDEDEQEDAKRQGVVKVEVLVAELALDDAVVEEKTSNGLPQKIVIDQSMTISAETKWGDVHLYKSVIDQSMTIFSV